MRDGPHQSRERSVVLCQQLCLAYRVAAGRALQPQVVHEVGPVACIVVQIHGQRLGAGAPGGRRMGGCDRRLRRGEHPRGFGRKFRCSGRQRRQNTIAIRLQRVAPRHAARRRVAIPADEKRGGRTAQRGDRELRIRAGAQQGFQARCDPLRDGLTGKPRPDRLDQPRVGGRCRSGRSGVEQRVQVL